MNTLTLDTTDPAVAEMVAQWKEGGQYNLSLNVTQGATTDGTVNFSVDEITDYGDASTPDEAEPGEDEEEKGAGPIKHKGMDSKNPALMIMIGHGRPQTETK